MTNSVTIAYLEISARLTGKTSRLIDMAVGVAAEGKQVVYVCDPRTVRGRGESMTGVHVLPDGEELPAGIDADQAVWFYDEFDLLKSVEIRDGAYYATTAAYLREAGAVPSADDILMRLLELNGFQHKRQLVPNDQLDFIRDHRTYLSHADFRRMSLGEFQS